VNQLEAKLNFELNSLQTKIEKLNEDIEKMKNIDELKNLTEEQKKVLYNKIIIIIIN